MATFETVKQGNADNQDYLYPTMKSEYLLHEYLQSLKHPIFVFGLSVFLIQIIPPVSVNIRTVATMLSLFDVPGITILETSRRKKNWCHSKHQNTEA